jgi:multidrug efflux pump subunit AcrB
MAKGKNKLHLWQRVGLFFYDKKYLTLAVWFLLVVFGAFSYGILMRREGFPSVEVPLGIVQIATIEQDAETVDRNYVQPIIKNAQEDARLKDVSSSATNEGAVVQLTFERGVDVDDSLNKLQSRLEGELPGNGQVAYIKVNASKLTAEGDDILISVHGQQSAEQLDTAAQSIALVIEKNSVLAKKVTTYPLIQKVKSSEDNNEVATQIRFDRFFNKGTITALPSVAIGVAGVEDVDQLDLYNEIENILSSEEVEIAGVDATIAVDFAESIKEQISGLQQNLLEGLLVVLVVSFVLISLRASLVTALSMTTTLAITIGVLQLIGYSLNTITLFSLVLCLALIVDDTTIMVEAIDKGLKSRQKFREVISQSLQKVARASATGTLTTVLAFAPMLFIGGILGEFIRAIPITIIISLVVSLVVSFVFIPLFMKVSYFRSNHSERHGIIGRIEEAFSVFLSKMLLTSATTKTRSISVKLHAVFIALVFIFFGSLLAKNLEFNIFPAPKDGREIRVAVEARNKERASIQATESVADAVLADIKNSAGNEIERISLLSQLGFADRDSFGATIVLVPIEERDKTSVVLAHELESVLQNNFQDYIVHAEPAGVGPPAGVFTVRIRAGESLEGANSLANDIREFLASATLQRVDGTTAQFTDIQVTPAVVVSRSQDDRVLSVSAGFDATDVSTLVSLAQDEVETQFTNETVKKYGLSENAIEFDFGQEEENQDSFSSMGKAAIPLFFAMIILMALLFRSVLQAFLILTALPFAFFGVMAGLSLTNNAISFFTMLGVFALIGISVNNAILLTDYANQERDKGATAAEAMAHALRMRLRPLVTTSVTSILALLPLALNDPFWEGIAYTLIFGLLSSTILVIFVFPYFYLIEEGMRVRLKKLRAKF